MFDFYQVGGAVRDGLLGLKSKDIDYVAVPSVSSFGRGVRNLFQDLHDFLTKEKYEIFLSTPDCFTIRAKFPKHHEHAGTVADFVLARKEVGYLPGTRKPIIVPGTLHDDLERRDFTVNAIAQHIDGTLVDPFDGETDLGSRVLRTPLPCEITFNDDPLRILRAIRFAITKEFFICPDIIRTMKEFDYESKMPVVSEERIRDEMYKCFKHDTLFTLEYLQQFESLRNYIFTKTKLWLKPTNEQ